MTVVLAGFAGAAAGVGFALSQGATWTGGAAALAREIAALTPVYSDPWLGFRLALSGFSLLLAFALVRYSERIFVRRR